jgi:hypothetical protein
VLYGRLGKRVAWLRLESATLEFSCGSCDSAVLCCSFHGWPLKCYYKPQNYSPVITIRNWSSKRETDAGCTFPTFSPPKGVLLLLVGGVLIGFGTRYAGGCTLVTPFLVWVTCNSIFKGGYFFYRRIDYVLFFIPLNF